MLRRGSFHLGMEHGGQVLAAGLELFTPQAQPVFQDTDHKGAFLLGGVVLAALEEQPLIGAVQRPCAYGEAELNVRLYLPGVGRAVK